MIKLLYFVAFLVSVAYTQENALRNLPSSLRECYENKYLLERDNRLPHTLNALLAVIRKIENTEGLNMDLRSLSIALLHRFRLDGIVPNPAVPVQDGVTPFAPNAFQFFRHAQTLRFIPGSAMLFPNNSITDIERCTLHFMFSSSIEIFQRGDESKVCRFANGAYRYMRSISDDDVTIGSTNTDVETLSPEEIENMYPKGGAKGAIDPNSFYPELPPNHPHKARMFDLPAISKCPVENGVIKTRWGAVSAGLVLAGIAAGSQPETVTLEDLQLDALQNDTSSSKLTLDNKWLATLAGDLAELALLQGPKGKDLTIGADGNWNSTALPRWYFLNTNERLWFTTAEVRGDLDGLILSDKVDMWYNKISNLKLSQVFDMYYSARGFFHPSVRACNRKELFSVIAPDNVMNAQAYSAALILDPDISKATLDFSVINKFVGQAVKELSKYIPSSISKDLSCEETDRLNDFNQISTDITIVLDTNWRFSDLQPILAHLLDNIDINQFNSNFTIMNGHNGDLIMNSTNDILKFFNYNSSHYDNMTHGFDLPKTFEKLNLLLLEKLEKERSEGIGGARSDIVLLMPYMSSISKSDKDYCLETMKRMREQIPDTTILILTYGSKDTWSDLVQNSAADLFSINVGDTEAALAPLTSVVSRIKQVPKRLINSQCGADYVASGSTNSYTDYIEPQGVNFYRLHPNYFFSSENTGKIKIQGSGGESLTICTSRDILHVNNTRNISPDSCKSITSDEYSITFSCADATYIHQCPPVYISITANSSSSNFQCTDPKICRFPHLIKYTVSYENLLCTSGSIRNIFSPVILILLLSYLAL